jgi:hypothetical protein
LNHSLSSPMLQSMFEENLFGEQSTFRPKRRFPGSRKTPTSQAKNAAGGVEIPASAWIQR